MMYLVDEAKDEMGIEEAVEYVVEYGSFEDIFNDYLNETEVEVFGMTFYGEDILKSDPTAYRTALLDFADGMREDVQWTIEQILINDTDEVYGIEITKLGE